MEENDLKNFALTEEEYDKYKDLDIKTSVADLENFDFSSGAELKLDEYHELINLYRELLKVMKLFLLSRSQWILLRYLGSH